MGHLKNKLANLNKTELETEKLRSDIKANSFWRKFLEPATIVSILAIIATLYTVFFTNYFDIENARLGNEKVILEYKILMFRDDSLRLSKRIDSINNRADSLQIDLNNRYKKYQNDSSRYSKLESLYQSLDSKLKAKDRVLWKLNNEKNELYDDRNRFKELSEIQVLSIEALEKKYDDEIINKKKNEMARGGQIRQFTAEIRYLKKLLRDSCGRELVN